MESDAFAELKQRQREMWGSFAPTAMFTTPVAAHLVGFAGVASGETVLDVGTGTGVVAITAANAGARVSALDLTPALLQEAVQNAKVAGVDVAWTEGDAERLPYPDASFDVVLSQFGHMFAPRPDVAVAEIRRVLKAKRPRYAFATWPPDALIGQIFQFIFGRNSPPVTAGCRAAAQMGDSIDCYRPARGKLRRAVVRQRRDDLAGAQFTALSCIRRKLGGAVSKAR